MARHQFFCLLARLALWHSQREGERPREQPAVKSPAADGEVAAYAASLADVILFCEENYTKPLTVPQLAAQMFLSPDHFSRLFSMTMGVPPGLYLRRLRLERAQTLLRTTQLTITEIAQQTGLRDPNQLSHAFRAAFGISPSGYRARGRK